MTAFLHLSPASPLPADMSRASVAGPSGLAFLFCAILRGNAA